MRRGLACAALVLAACGGSDAGGGDGGTDGAVGGGPDALVIDAAPRLADDLIVREVVVFQAVAVTVARNGAAATRNAPVIAGRDAVVRVLVDLDTGFTPRAIKGELIIEAPGASPAVFTDTVNVSVPSTHTDLFTTFDFTVPGAHLTDDAAFSVRLVDDTSAPVADATSRTSRYPMDGTTAPVEALSDMGGINIVLVPVQYDTDGSGRLPDTSPEQLAIIKGLVTGLYPVTDVTLTVRAPLPWSDSLTLTGNFDFGDLNQALINLKESDGAPSATYYYGMVRPADTYSEYCGGSCTTGQAFVVRNPSSGRSRVGSGVGYSGEKYARTLAHEIGHMHGRSHAPCDTSSSDPDYPHAGGSIGVWGYDPRSGEFLSPDVTTDVMGYCDERWISDYNFAAFYERIVALANLSAPGPRAPALAHRFLRLTSGAAEWGRTVHVPPSTSASATVVQFQTRDGRTVGKARAEELEEAHGHAQWLLLPPPPAGATHVVVDRGAFAPPIRIRL